MVYGAQIRKTIGGIGPGRSPKRAFVKFRIALIAVAWVLMNGCAGVANAPNDSPSRVLNEMKRPSASEMSTVTVDPRDAHIAALEQEISKLREQNRTVPVPASRGEQTVVIVLRDEEFFASGAPKPTQDVLGTLRRIAEILKPHAASITRIRVEGHTDSQRIQTKQFPSNKELSEARAQIVAWYLQRETGFPSDRFAIRGYGATKPVASNSTAEGRTRNRRVEIAITANGTAGGTDVIRP